MTAAADEFELIGRYFDVATGRTDVELAVGDDAALIRPRPGELLAVAVDTLVAGVHFPDDAPADAIGHKALAVNLSDLAAMGAEPAWALLSITLPEADETWLSAFARGFLALASTWDLALIGGDTTRGPLAVTVQVSGYAPLPLRRDGARPGDRLWVSGAPGEAAAGLRCWQAGRRHGAEAQALIERLHRPQPRVALGLALRGIATAAVDVSDGLLADAGHIAERSDVAIEVDAASVPLSPALRAEAGEAALDLALGGGDDYELCFTAPADSEARVLAAARNAGVTVTAIGEVSAGAGITVSGAGRGARQSGYRHFGGAR
jgi:thiamine-monophosphate kinase